MAHGYLFANHYVTIDGYMQAHEFLDVGARTNKCSTGDGSVC